MIEEIAKEMAMLSTGIIFNREAGWSKLLEDKLKEKLEAFEKKTKEEFLKKILPKEVIFLWLASNDGTGEEKVLDFGGYKKLDKEEGWKWSGHTIQSGFNYCLKSIKSNASKEGINLK